MPRSTAFEQRFCERTAARSGAACWVELEHLVDDPNGRNLLAELKSDPGQVGLETLLQEIDKLTAVRRLGLPAGLFADASEKLVGSLPASSSGVPASPRNSLGSNRLV